MSAPEVVTEHRLDAGLIFPPEPNYCADSEHKCDPAPGFVLGTRCNVCADPLDNGGCPLCATCCEREP